MGVANVLVPASTVLADVPGAVSEGPNALLSAEEGVSPTGDQVSGSSSL